MSALPPKADFGSLFNQLVGTSQQVTWHLETKRLRGCEIDEQLKVRWLYDWQVGRFFAFKNTANIETGSLKSVRLIGTITGQQAGSDTITRLRHCGERVPKRNKGDLPTAGAKVSVVTNAQSFGQLPHGLAYRTFDLVFPARFDNDQLQSQALHRCF